MGWDGSSKRVRFRKDNHEVKRSGVVWVVWVVV